MSKIVVGIFSSPDSAAGAVTELKREGFRDDISVISRKWQDTHIRFEKETTGVEGGIVGALIGGLAGLLIGSGAFFVPGIGTLLVAGPLTALMGATGALTGGIIGFFIDAGIPEDTARLYEEAVRHGDVLVVVSAEDEGKVRAREIMEHHGARDTDISSSIYASV